MFEFFFTCMAIFNDTLSGIMNIPELSLFIYFIIFAAGVAVFVMLTRKTRS